MPRAFDKQEVQFIDDVTPGSCTGELVARVTLGADANRLTVDFSFTSGDLDMSVEEPDGSCVWHGSPASANGGQHSGDVASGGTESYNIVNGPAGEYVVRAHCHGVPQQATVHIYGER